ncbi:MAG: hypothetical protein QOF97_881 [Acidimicrobiaceae bacterium]
MPPEPTSYVAPPSTDAAALIASLAQALSAAAEAPVSERWTWWDTFDGRLHNAGLVLASAPEAAGGHVLSVRPSGGVAPLATVVVAELPRLASDLPPGRVRDRLAPALEMRALLPIVSVDATTHLFVLRNDDDKVVTRVAVDELRSVDGTDLGLWVRLLPVRGYEKAASRARDVLVSAGVTPASDDVVEIVATAAGDGTRPPGAYSSKLSIPIDPGQSAASAFLTVLLVLLDAIEANFAGTVDDVDSEFLHDLRVAVRRSRSALKHAGGVLPDELLGCFRPELAWLQEITGPTRDLDVQLLGLPEEAAALAPDAAAELEPFAVLLAKRQRDEQSAMAETLRSDRARALLQDWRETIESLASTATDPADADAGEWGSWPSGATRPIAALAAKRVARRYRRLLQLGGEITEQTPAEALHDLRKQGKELRYLFELFGSLFPASALGPVIKDLKELQDNLGEFQDTEVQRHALRGFGEELVAAGAPVGTILTLAQLVERLALRQHAARSEFAARFARFSSQASRKRFEVLLGDGSAQ